MKWWISVTAMLLVAQPTQPLHVQYGTPPDNHHQLCPHGNNCTTLQQCIEDDNSCFRNNTNLLLLAGTHTVTGEHDVTLLNLYNFTMTGPSSGPGNPNSPPQPSATIACNNSTSFQFRFSQHLAFANLAFKQCGAAIAENISHVQAALVFFVVTHVRVESVSVTGSRGFGLHADKAYGNVTISHSIFSGNMGYSQYYGGNVHLWYKACKENTSANVTIRDSWFVNSTNKKITFQNNSNATGLEILVDCPYIRLHIHNITARNNTASKGGNLAVALVDRHSGTANVTISHSSIEQGQAERGGGLTVWSQIHLASNNTTSCGAEHNDRVILKITDTNFTDNYASADGGALYLGHYEKGDVDCIVRMIMFVNCKFLNNTVYWLGSGAAAVITKYETVDYIPHPEPQFEVAFHQCTFTNNSYKLDSHVRADIHLHGIINALSVGKLLVKDSTFSDNNSTAISLQSSNVILQGEVLFLNNHAYNGGALELCTSSLIFIKNNTDTNVTFIGNHAHKAGGAIYAQDPCLDTVPACFFQPLLTTPGKLTGDCNELQLKMSLTFIDNTADMAGDAIFNGAVDYCYLLFNHHIHNTNTGNTWSKCVFDDIFTIKEQKSPSIISSEPRRVCLCPDFKSRNCSVIDYTYPNDVFSGESFNISVVAIGQRDGVVPTVVEAYLVGNNNNNTLTGNKVSKTRKTCTNMTIAIGSNDSFAFFNLSVQDQSWKFTQYPQVKVNLASCPHGFTKGTTKCVCNENLLTRWKLSCNDDSFKYKRLEPIWVGCEGQDCLFSACTFDYCNLDILNEEHDLNMHPDEQCDFNRTGRVCGGCKANHSVVIGSSRCLHCTNTLLGPLLVTFAIAGIALFVFLFAFNFTVTEGTINGFILYANIVHLNKNIFFPTKWFAPFSVLIAWFNLDVGIETCFFDGLDEYTKLWLQYAFNGYIWIIGALIVLLSRNYIIITRLFGRNATKVIATLFLLSFTKVIGIISKSVSFTLIQDSELKIRHFICDFNGELLFLHQKHIPLYIFSCLLMVVFVFFLTALTFIQCLQKISSFRLLRWVEKFRPFFEAFTGPCRHNYRFWPGLLLMCRAALVTVTSVFHNPKDSLLSVAVITAVCMFLLCLACVTPKGVYRKWQLNILEGAFLLNLIITCIVLLINESIKKDTIPFIYHHSLGHLFIAYMFCSTSLAVCMLIAILLYHAYAQLKSSRLRAACLKWIRQRRLRAASRQHQETAAIPATSPGDRPTSSIVTLDNSTSVEGSDEHLLAHSMPPVVAYNQYREPLLADDD